MPVWLMPYIYLSCVDRYGSQNMSGNFIFLTNEKINLRSLWKKKLVQNGLKSKNNFFLLRLKNFYAHITKKIIKSVFLIESSEPFRPKFLFDVTKERMYGFIRF